MEKRMTTEPVAPEVSNDPWLQDSFAPLDLRTGPDHLARLIAEDANANPNEFPEAPIETVVDPALAPVPPAPVYAAPETVALEDGSSVTTTNDAEGWHATVNPGNGKTLQVFHARTERELIKALMVAQANATKKINQQEKQIKLIRKMDEPAPPKSNTKDLTADQIFEIKTLQQSDPVAAWKKTIELTTGMTFEEFVSAAKSGKEVKQEMTRTQIARAFFAIRPEYRNTKANEDKMLEHLGENKQDFTVDNLVKAYDDLLEAGLLPDITVKPRPVAPVTPPPAPPVVATPEVPPATPEPTNPRIERPVGRTNATFGLRPGETTTVRPPTSREVPSVEELENLPDDQIAQLFAGVVRAKAQARR
jgi:hypothetical protein